MRASVALVAVVATVIGTGCFRCTCDCGAREPDCVNAECAVGEECDPVANACAPIECFPGVVRCAPGDAGSLEVCNSTGDAWNPLGACRPDQACVETGIGASCTPPECGDGLRVCEPGGTVVICRAGTWLDPAPCPTDQICDPAMDGCANRTCEAGARACGPSGEVVGCNDLGTTEETLESCADACLDGACVSYCVLAAVARGSVGCSFLAVDTNNTNYDDVLQFDIVVANPSADRSATVAILSRDGSGGPWNEVASDIVAPGAIRIFIFGDSHVEDTALVPANAYRVVSNEPIGAWQVNSDDLNFASVSSGATILLPGPTLGTSYRVLGLPTVPDLNGGVSRSGFAVVGDDEGTTVTVVAGGMTLAGPGVPALAPGQSYTTTLNAGDLLQIEMAAPGDDPSGTLVSADLPVAVFSHHESAHFPLAVQPDHYEEQLPPIDLWGMEYLAARAWAGGETAVWRVIASEDATTVTFDYAAGVTGLPPPGTGTVLQAGEWLEVVVDGPIGGPAPTPGDPGDFYVQADQPVMLAHWTFEIPNMVVPAPVERWSTRVLFLAPPFFEDVLTAMGEGTPGVLDGAALPPAWLGALAGFWTYRAPLMDGSHLLEGGDGGHVAITVVGTAGNCGYAYTGSFGDW